MPAGWSPSRPGCVFRAIPARATGGSSFGFALPACGQQRSRGDGLASGALLGTGFGFLFAAPVLNPIVLASTWAAFPDKTWLLGRVLQAPFYRAFKCTSGFAAQAKLLETALLEERRMSRPLSSVGLLERRGGCWDPRRFA